VVAALNGNGVSDPCGPGRRERDGAIMKTVPNGMVAAAKSSMASAANGAKRVKMKERHRRRYQQISDGVI